MMWDSWNMMSGWGDGTGLWMFGGMLVIGLAIVVGAWLLIRARTDARSSGSSALEILRERHARGEITAAEFEAMKRTISA
jgi:putative membrane protein